MQRKINFKNVAVLATLMLALIIGLATTLAYIKGAQSNVHVNANVALKYNFPFYKDKSLEVLDQVRVNGAKEFRCAEEETYDYEEAVNEILRRYGNKQNVVMDVNDFTYSWGKMHIHNTELVTAIEKAVADGDGYMVVYNQTVVEAAKQVKTQQDVFEYIKKHYSLGGAGTLLTVIRKHTGSGKSLGILAKDICKEAGINSFKSNDFGVYTSNGFIAFEDLLS